MSETTEAVDQTADEDVIDLEDIPAESEPSTAAEDDAESESANAEAAKWRRQLRETEAQRDTLASQVDALQRQQIEAQDTAAGVKPAALWKTSELSALISEDGTVDAELVATAIDTARQELGIQPIGKGAYVPGVGGRPSATPKHDDFVDAFKPKRR
jgi:hypothetical protein